MTPQYRTIATGAGWLDVSTRGRLRFVGPDAVSFLHALVSNDVEGLLPGRGAYATWLTPQGRMITDLRVLRDTDFIVAEVPAGMATALAVRLDQLIFSEKVRVFDDTETSRAAAVFGEDAARVASAATGISTADVAALPMLGHVTHGDFRVIRTDDVVLPNFVVWMRASQWDLATAALSAAGAVELQDDAMYNALRIEAARPLFGVDMTTETIPLEAGLLDRAISTSKGCYVGQEVVIRILHRGGGRVAKHLVQFLAEPGVTEVPAAGTKVIDDGREVGSVTGAAIGPSLGRVVALGYVHRDSATVGRSVSLGADVPAIIVLPSGVS